MRKAIATNIITGFLGVGKTTAIQHLLSIKPAHEVWSVLVNEFGEIGIDGALLQGRNAHVREVAGGCICCVAGLPMKIALNLLIATTKPDRILIEPTGLGHPEEIIRTLTGEYYGEILDLRATLTLVDPRKIQEKYLEHPIFQDQLAVADVLIVNKTDLMNAEEKARMEQWLSRVSPETMTFWVEQGRVDLGWLDLSRAQRFVNHPHYHRRGLVAQREVLPPSVQLAPGQDYVRRENQGQGFFSCGWLFRPDWCFDFGHLFLWLSGQSVERAKAVINTTQGWHSFNAENGVLSVKQLELSDDLTLDSRLEFIDNKLIDGELLEQHLLTMRR